MLPYYYDGSSALWITGVMFVFCGVVRAPRRRATMPLQFCAGALRPEISPDEFEKTKRQLEG